MYFWNTKALAIELQEGSVDQKEKMKYFVIFMLSTYVIFDLSLYMQEDYSSNYFILSLADTGLMMIAVYLCYRINRDGDDSEFIDRFVCLSLPIAIRFIFAIFGFLLGLVILSVIIGDSFDPWAEEGSLLEGIEILLFEILFYWRIWVAMKWASHPQKGINKIDATA
jgi:hypothetical protein